MIKLAKKLYLCSLSELREIIEIYISIEESNKTEIKKGLNKSIIEYINKVKIIVILFSLTILNIYNDNPWPFLKFISKKKKIGVISMPNGQNVGNIMIKFSMFKKLEEFGLNASIIVPTLKIPNLTVDISFLNRTINSHLVIINDSFSELNESDFDYLLVNSDQTWGCYSGKYFYDIAVLKFAENWNVKKFIYGASMGSYQWNYNKIDEGIFKKLLKNFTGISFREKGTIPIIEEHLNFKSSFVLDPTLLIDKNYYLKEIKNYKINLDPKDKYIFIYQLDKNIIFEKVVNEAMKKYNFKVNKLKLERSDYIEFFIYSINTCQCVITDSFHGTVFSIIFNKPFISFSNSFRGKARFDSIKELFNIKNRIIEPSDYNNINIDLLIQPLNINQTAFEKKKSFSIHYLKSNLDII